MPALHVMYDPNEKVSIPSAEMIKKMGVSVVVISIQDGLDPERLEETSRRIARLLLTEVYKGTAAKIGEG